MKNILKKLTLVTLVGLMGLTISACGQGKNTPEDNKASNDSAKDEKSGFDFSSYPSDFNDWTTDTVQTYLKDCGLLGNEEFMLTPLSETDVAPLNATSGFMYVDPAAASVMDVVYSFDLNKDESKATLDSVIENKAIVIDGNTVAQMDAVLGQFAISYKNGTDDDHITKVVKAIKDLAAHYDIEPAYINEV